MRTWIKQGIKHYWLQQCSANCNDWGDQLFIWYFWWLLWASYDGVKTHRRKPKGIWPSCSVLPPLPCCLQGTLIACSSLSCVLCKAGITVYSEVLQCLPSFSVSSGYGKHLAFTAENKFTVIRMFLMWPWSFSKAKKKIWDVFLCNHWCTLLI